MVLGSQARHCTDCRRPNLVTARGTTIENRTTFRTVLGLKSPLTPSGSSVGKPEDTRSTKIVLKMFAAMLISESYGNSFSQWHRIFYLHAIPSNNPEGYMEEFVVYRLILVNRFCVT